MSYLNFIKDVEIVLPNIQGRVDGEYRMEAFQGVEFPRGSGNVFEFSGTRRLVADWFENIVTDLGKEFYGIETPGIQFCHVGTGNTPEAATDTQLVSFTAGIVYTDRTASAQGTAPYFGHDTRKYRFSPGFGGGDVNLNEVGASSTVTNGNLSSRSLTKNISGTPITIAVLANEYLDVFYKRRNYPAHIVEATGAPTDDTGTIDVSGTSYGYTIRPMQVTLGGNFTPSTSAAWGTGLNGGQVVGIGYGWNISSQARALDENMALGAVTAAPAGGTDASTTEGTGTYTNNSYSRELWYQWGIDDANFTVGIGGLAVKTKLGAYQILFDTPIPKIQGEVFTYYHDFSWDRKTTWV